MPLVVGPDGRKRYVAPKGGISPAAKKLTASTRTPSPSPQGKGPLDDVPVLGGVLDLLARPNYASANVAKVLTGKSKDDIFSAIGKGLSGEEKGSYSEVTNDPVTGFIGDVLLDPTTYVGVGLVGKGAKAIKTAADLKRTGNVAGAAGTAAKVATEAEDVLPVVTAKVREFASQKKAATATQGTRAVATTAKTEAGQAANINLSKLDLDEDLKKIIVTTADENQQVIAGARRGRISNKELLDDLAPKVGKTTEQLANTRVGTALNAETLLASRIALARKTKEVRDLHAGLTAPGGDSTEKLLRFQQAIVDQARLQKAVSGATSEAGRALQSQKIVIDQALAEGTPEAYAKALKALGGRENIEELSKRLSQIDPSDELGLYKFIRSIDKPGFFDYVSEWWVNSVLSGIPTHIINPSSNVLFGAAQIPTRALAALIDIPVAKLQGRSRELYLSEAPAMLQGWLRGTTVGAQKGLYILQHGFSPEDVRKFDLGRPQAFQGKLGTAVNIPTRLLGAEDAISGTMAYFAELYALATRTAIKEGLRGAGRDKRIADLIANPTADLIEQAGKFRRYATFTDEPGKVTSQILGLREKVPALRFVIPFISTPTNLFKRGLEHSPLGFAGALRTGGAGTSLALARATVGSSIMAAFASYLVQGHITGSAPKDPAERDRWYREGKQPYSVRIGDKWVQYQRLDPFATPLTAVAALYDAWQETGDAPDAKRIAQLAYALGRSLTDRTYLGGIQDLINAIEDPERYASRFLTNTATGFVPYSGTLRSVARATDSKIREPNSLADSVMALVPGLSEKVPAKLDAFGQEISRPDPGLAQLQPIRTSAERRDQVDEALKGLDLKVGFTSGRIGDIKLTDAQKRDYQRIAGQETRAQLVNLLSSPKFAKLTREEKKTEVERTIETARRKARAAIADEGITASRSPKEIAQAIDARLSTFTKKREKAAFILKLRRDGVLTSEVMAELNRLGVFDTRTGKPRPSERGGS